MRKAVLVLALLAAACSKSTESRNASEEADAGGPQVGVTGGKGIAISYAYTFRLPAERVAETQEDHARQCEELGSAACRIWGMTYEVGRGRWVRGKLELRLAPEAARKFGKQAIDTTMRHGGMLARAELSSEDVGATLGNARANKSAIEAERARIEKQLAQPGLGSTERNGLQSRLSEIASSSRASDADQEAAAEKLASTPMVFEYESGEVDQSLRDGPILGAVKDGWGNIVAGTAVIVTIVVSLIPWMIAALLAVWIWRSIVAWMRRRSGVQSALDSSTDSHESAEP